MSLPTQIEKITFDVFEVNLKTEELWRGSRKIRCQRQPFRVLRALLTEPGKVVSREELQRAIWGSDSPADADHSLGIAVNKLREALGDSADAPRYIETLSRRGYRFIAPVAVVLEPETAPLSSDAGTAAMSIAELEHASARNGYATPRDVPEALAGADLAAGQPSLLEAHLVSSAEPSSLNGDPALFSPAQALQQLSRPVSSRRLFALAALLVTGVLAGLLLAHLLGDSAAPRRIDQLTHNDSIFPGVPAMESFPVLASDGSRLYTSILDNGQTQLASIDADSGAMQQLQLPSEIVNPALGDISPDGTRLLVRSRLSSGSEQPVWIVPRSGGSALRVGSILAHDAVWMPDGQSVLYAVGNDLNVMRPSDGSISLLATLPGRAFWMRWSPDGKLLRFTLLNPLSHTSSLWQLAPGGSVTPLLQGWTNPASECCGVWTPDGKAYVFQSAHDGGSDLWRLRGNATGKPEKLTNGPLRYTAPMVAHGSDLIYCVGLDVRSELQRYDLTLKRFVVERGFLSDASRVNYSHDTQWVAWTGEAGHLWRARATDGSERVQLTQDDMEVFLARWSPDGRSLLAMARKPGEAWQLFLVHAEGGAPERLLHEDRNEADPTWSPDGKQVAFGRTPDLMGRENGPKQIELLDLATRNVTPIPGSEGLFSPRWSPDGRWIAALTLGEQRLMLYNTIARTWRALGTLQAADPVWTADSSALYIHAVFAQPQTIERVSIPSGSATTIATLTSPLVSDKADYVFVGITREDAPLVRVRTATGNLYSLAMGR